MVLKNNCWICTVLLLILVSSCSMSDQGTQEGTVFRYNEHSNISSLDPAFAKDISDIWAVNQLFNGLVRLDENLNVQPDIGKSWTISEDGKSYTFQLRTDVHFHKHPLFGSDSTRLVNASDFEYSLNWI